MRNLGKQSSAAILNKRSRSMDCRGKPGNDEGK
jgi:hypothetical protein